MHRQEGLSGPSKSQKKSMRLGGKSSGIVIEELEEKREGLDFINIPCMYG